MDNAERMSAERKTNGFARFLGVTSNIALIAIGSRTRPAINESISGNFYAFEGVKLPIALPVRYDNRHNYL
jgi:hypothetical protein